MPAIQKDLNPLAVRVGEKIRTLRKAKGMKQYTLASEAGYESRSTIAAIENGIILPSLDKAIEIAHILGVEVATLVEEDPVEAVVKDLLAMRLLSWSETRCQTMAETLRQCVTELESLAVKAQ
jgi:transcriptional regulator with XRE-family HTH domain